MKKFSFRLGKLELLSCNEYLLQRDEHVTAEIIVKDKGYTLTIAFWESDKSNEEFHLCFVGDRPFHVNSKDFMLLAKTGQLLLNKRRINK